MENLVDVVQLTPRRSFDVAKCFSESSQLNLLCSDFVLANNWIASRILPKRVSYERYVFKPNSGRVISSFYTGLKFRYQLKCLPAHQKFQAQLNAAESLASCYLKEREQTGTECRVVYCLDCAALSVFRESPTRRKVLEQCIAPRSSQFTALKKYGTEKEVDQWAPHYEAMARVEAEEWEIADIILSPSSFVTNELLEQGVSKSKIRFLPYWTPFDPLKEVPDKPADAVYALFVGNDSRRKGLGDFYLAASKLSDLRSLEFLVAGSVEEECKILARKYPEARVHFIGRLSHAELRKTLNRSHIFFLPSYLEGSSVATYEAMSYGLATVTTLETGSVVEHGVSGYAFAAGDIGGFVGAIRHLAENEEIRNAVAARALERIRNFQYEHYAGSLREIAGAIGSESSLPNRTAIVHER